MNFISTEGKQKEAVPFSEALLYGLAYDGGLYMPISVPRLKDRFWQNINKLSLTDIGFEIARLYLKDEIEDRDLRNIIDDAINFDAPLVPLHDHVHILELFHGPTLAFKDFGARFMARAFAHLHKDKDREIVILAATSGDTGSAVAHGFYKVPGIKVCLLYPSGKVSKLQEQQMTTLGENITALEVDGTFDDCQRMVKDAFSDQKLRDQILLSSANSINIGRLLPQTFYYVYALSQLGIQNKPVFSVPSGNFGNLTAGLIAAEMGMPTEHFIAATNANDVVPKYLQSGEFHPRASVKTISNAMDVGNPSNFDRISYLYHQSLDEIRKHISGYSFTDEETRKCIREVYEKTGYILDPHAAVGYLAGQSWLEHHDVDVPMIVLGTAHPAKFRDVVEPLIGKELELPPQLEAAMQKEKKSTPLDGRYEALRDFLLEDLV